MLAGPVPEFSLRYLVISVNVHLVEEIIEFIEGDQPIAVAINSIEATWVRFQAVFFRAPQCPFACPVRKVFEGTFRFVYDTRLEIAAVVR